MISLIMCGMWRIILVLKILTSGLCWMILCWTWKYWQSSLRILWTSIPARMIKYVNLSISSRKMSALKAKRSLSSPSSDLLQNTFIGSYKRPDLTACMRLTVNPKSIVMIWWYASALTIMILAPLRFRMKSVFLLQQMYWLRV